MRLRSTGLKIVSVGVANGVVDMVRGIAKCLHICCRGGKSRVIRCDAPLLILTTYSSLPKIHDALRRARRDAPDLCFTTCCFDEAHNLHTASRPGIPLPGTWGLVGVAGLVFAMSSCTGYIMGKGSG